MQEQYNNIGAIYQEFKSQTTLPIAAEKFTFFKLLGNLKGKKILDLACGTGFYTRLFKQKGATKVVGVDISEEMLKVARKQEEQQPLGIEYHLGDAVKLEQIGSFELITAVYLLDYAQNPEQLLSMLVSVRKNLEEEGRFVAVTTNPDFKMSQSNTTKYGVTVTKQESIPQGYYYEIEFHTSSPFTIQCFGWNRSVYEEAVKEAGLKNFSWHPIEIPPHAIEDYGADYWQDFCDNNLIIALSCEK
ncbi:MAG: class I SAM-dependent methyltransferase [Xenococcus sp. (in: cyanobacteria)]